MDKVLHDRTSRRVNRKDRSQNASNPSILERSNPLAILTDEVHLVSPCDKDPFSTSSDEEPTSASSTPKADQVHDLAPSTPTFAAYRPYQSEESEQPNSFL